MEISMNIIEDIKTKIYDLALRAKIKLMDTYDGAIKITLRDYQHLNATAALVHYKSEWIKHKSQENYNPVFGIIKATVGAGKTYMIASVARYFSDRNVRFLIIARDAEIVSQDSLACNELGVINNIHCAGLNASRSTSYPVTVASEGTIYSTIVRDERRKKENAANGVDIEPGTFDTGTYLPKGIMIDEVHHVDPVDTFLCIQAAKEGFDIYSGQNYKTMTTKFKMFSVIITHFIMKDPSCVCIGLTGTWYRSTESIMGKLWQTQIGQSIDTAYLVERDMLVETQWGVTAAKYKEMEEATKNYIEAQNGKPSGSAEVKESELNALGDKTTKKDNEIITADFMLHTKERNGVLITCASKKHCESIASCIEVHFIEELLKRLRKCCDVPEKWEFYTKDELIAECEKRGIDSTGGYVIINQETKNRKQELDKVKSGYYKYTLQMGILTTGVDVPLWDTIVILRPIISATLYVQLLGRGMRKLKPGQVEAGIIKLFNLVLDYAGSSEVLADNVYDPILEQAQYQLMTSGKLKKKECPLCEAVNSGGAAQCIGVETSTHEVRKYFLNDEHIQYEGKAGETYSKCVIEHETINQRCEYFWPKTFIECPNEKCGAKNNKRAHECRKCGHELYDASTKLEHKPYTKDQYIPILSCTFHRTRNEAILVKVVFDDKTIDGKQRTATIFYKPLSDNPQLAKITKSAFYNNFTKVFIKNKDAQQRMYKAKTYEQIMSQEKHFKAPPRATHRVSSKTKKDIVRFGD
jgi:superfamily II DNA or RNA helicase